LAVKNVKKKVSKGCPCVSITGRFWKDLPAEEDDDDDDGDVRWCE
jgi:hypothetical protein